MVSTNLEHGYEHQTVPAHHYSQLHGYGKSLLARRFVFFVEGNMAWVSSLAIVTGNTAGTPRRDDTPWLRVYRKWCLLPAIGQIAHPPTTTRPVTKVLN